MLPSTSSRRSADPAAAARGARRVKAAYTKPYIAHASIAPSCALARWSAGKLEVWTQSQGIFGLRQDLAKIFGMEEEHIVVTHAEGAGCYGHHGADDVALDAALLARAANGRPVRLQWMREDEFAGSRTARRWRSSSRRCARFLGYHRLVAARILEQRPRIARDAPSCRRSLQRLSSRNPSSFHPPSIPRCPRAAPTETASRSTNSPTCVS